MQEPQLNAEILTAMGLDPVEVNRHHQRILQALQNRESDYLPIIDTCRLDNGGIVPLPILAESTDARGFVAVTLAAGAASRYSEPLLALRQALESGNLLQLNQSLEDLVAHQARTWPLPPALAQLLAQDTPIPKFPTASEISSMLAAMDQPKGLFPCNPSGLSFASMKNREHASLQGLEGQAFIVAPHKRPDFEALAQREGFLPETTFLEQGPELSTIRFWDNGSPVMEEGRYSPVPAGHGTLLKLWPRLHQRFATAHSALIRNVDNVTGTDAEVIDATYRFLNFHAAILKSVRLIRRHLAVGHGQDCLVPIQSLWELFPTVRKPGTTHKKNSYLQSLWDVQQDIFQLSPAQKAHVLKRHGGDEQLALQWLYSRPVNTLGQVPNSGRDVGGTAAFVRTEIGPEKVCLELPHASPEDVARFLKDPTRATHFNPVFVAAELGQTLIPAHGDHQPLWILARKKYQGQPVLYHETVLFELLGNNMMANVLFPEIPRFLFHPHKTLGAH